MEPFILQHGDEPHVSHTGRTAQAHTTPAPESRGPAAHTVSKAPTALTAAFSSTTQGVRLLNGTRGGSSGWKGSPEPGKGGR